MCVGYANACIRDVSICGFGPWNQPPVDTEGPLYMEVPIISSQDNL